MESFRVDKSCLHVQQDVAYVCELRTYSVLTYVCMEVLCTPYSTFYICTPWTLMFQIGQKFGGLNEWSRIRQPTLSTEHTPGSCYAVVCIDRDIILHEWWLIMCRKLLSGTYKTATGV